MLQDLFDRFFCRRTVVGFVDFLIRRISTGHLNRCTIMHLSTPMAFDFIFLSRSEEWWGRLLHCALRSETTRSQSKLRYRWVLRVFAPILSVKTWLWNMVADDQRPRERNRDGERVWYSVSEARERTKPGEDIIVDLFENERTVGKDSVRCLCFKKQISLGVL
jgi:hypothetical protein